VELTVQNVYGLLLRSRLLSIDEAKAMFARWQEEAGDSSTNLARFAAWMVAHKYLTEYQAGLLARGHADGFYLGDYKILDRLGKGRMAGVYKARYKLGQVVAIKVLPPSKAKEPTLLARFQREARLAIRLKHPNVVRSFQTGVQDGLHYLVMEYLDGETLEEVMQRRRAFGPPEAVRLIHQALQGLQHIHAQGLVHRDLKPANLMLVPAPAKDVTTQCTVKILDIGLGRALFEEGPDPQNLGLTGEGVLLGTPDYMAPEQARDPRATDIRADVYSLGCVLYHLLAGQTPFPDTNIISQMIKHATEPPRPIKDIPDGLQQILNWMMAKDPAGRYPTPERAAGALEVFLAAGSAPASSPDLDPQMQPYLTWLEGENKRNPPASGNAIPIPPTLPHVVLPPVGKTAAASGSGAGPRPQTGPPVGPKQEKRDRREKGAKPGEGEKRRPKKKRRPPAVLPGGAPPAPAVFDVELVTLETGRAAKPPGMGGLTRRDFAFFFGGVGATLAAFGVGWGLAALLRLFRGDDKE
jgi:serine/threonine protein kinase